MVVESACWTSSRRIRPPTPVPLMVAGSGPASPTKRRTSGDNTNPPRPIGPAPTTPLEVGATAGGGAAARAAPFDDGLEAVAPGSPILASGVPTGTVSPAATRISSRTPSYGDGISESTLSVDTSKSASSKAMTSPTLRTQELTVPSVHV